MRAFVVLAALAAALLCCVESAQAQGTTGSPLTGFDFYSSTVFQEGQTSFSGLGVRGRMQHSRLVKEVDFLPAVEYWQTNVSALGFRTTRRDATLGGFARWTFPTSRAYHPYLGAGLGVHFLHNAVESPEISRDNDVVRGAVSALAGLSFGTDQRFGNFFELEFHDLTGERQLKFNMGMSWNMRVTPAAN
ncbi:MAG: hypothetical protein HZA61_10585 [Candidatus Eisenbacteria bacterium]|uniref:Outer membrane protein beta-barrel domain-containing protein n=1 Tax=Eiseniibacteriota bacterium TaxID=2212470 RepID=A0A933SEQ1_UNCEI|nr:hypothetical protein [Candidatus Eisenbacteria bacterium]